jgi:hypothetical protein
MTSPQVAAWPHFLAVRALAFASLLPSVAFAEWLPNGNSVTPSGSAPVVCADGSEGAFVSWNQSPASAITRFAGSGDVAEKWPAGGSPARANDLHPYDDYPVLVPDDEGGAFVVLGVVDDCVAGCNVQPRAVYVQRITADGSVAAGWPPRGIRATSTWMPGRRDRWLRQCAVPDGHGGVIVAWQYLEAWSGPVTGPVFVQRIGPDGSRVWGESGVTVCDTTGFRSHPDVAPDGRGGAFVFWCERRSTALAGHLYGQHVNAAGTPLWARHGALLSEPFEPRYDVWGNRWFVARPVAAAAPAPEVERGPRSSESVVAWGGTSPSGVRLHVAMIRDGGRDACIETAHVATTAGEPFDVRLVPLQDGGAIVGWLHARQDSTVEVRAQRLTSAGRHGWVDGGVSLCDLPGLRDRLAMSGDGHHGAYAVWTDSRPEGALFATRLTGEGAPARGWPANGAMLGAAPSPASGSRRIGALEIAAVGRGDAVVVWQDRWDGPSPPTRNGEILATRLERDGPAARVSLRRSTGWVPGAADAAHDVSIRGLGPSAAHRGGVVRLTLADATPARLDLFDVAGRRLWTREIGSLGPGDHELRLGGEHVLPAGVYFARLSQGVLSASATIIIR